MSFGATYMLVSFIVRKANVSKPMTCSRACQTDHVAVNMPDVVHIAKGLTGKRYNGARSKSVDLTGDLLLTIWGTKGNLRPKRYADLET